MPCQERRGSGSKQHDAERVERTANRLRMIEWTVAGGEDRARDLDGADHERYQDIARPEAKPIERSTDAGASELCRHAVTLCRGSGYVIGRETMSPYSRGSRRSEDRADYPV